MRQICLNMVEDVNSYLVQGESVIGSYKYGKQDFYATDRRLVTYQKNKFSDVAYNHITTIAYEKKKRKWILYLGILFFLFGIVLLPIGVTSAGGALIVIAIILFVLYFIFTIKGYEIRTSGGEVIPFPVKKQSDAETFLKTVRERMFQQKP